MCVTIVSYYNKLGLFFCISHSPEKDRSDTNRAIKGIECPYVKDYKLDGETVLMRCDYSDKNFVDKSECKGFLKVDCGMCI